MEHLDNKDWDLWKLERRPTSKKAHGKVGHDPTKNPITVGQHQRKAREMCGNTS
jgi:hypothetical protein